VSTTVANDGGPVITAHAATDTTAATKLVRAAQQAPGAVSVELDSAVRAADVPAGADPLRNLQWDLPRINAPTAWSQSTGTGVTVAVVDTGVDSTHPDLAGQVLPGGDFITGTEGQAIDPNGHGTHVAGTIAAIAGNNVGVAGVAPDAKILPVRVLGADGGGYMSTAAQGVVYAAEHGADVINLSLSATTPTEAMTNAVAYARSKNVVVVAAAGNMRAQGSPVSYPAANDGVIAVAATDSADKAAPFSNREATITYTITASGKAWARRAVQISVTTTSGTATSATTTDTAGKVTFARKITGRTQVKLIVPATSTSVQATSASTTFTLKATTTKTKTKKK
jgi:serine protease